MPAGFRRHLVGKTLRDVCLRVVAGFRRRLMGKTLKNVCTDIAEIRFDGKVVTI